jgi:DnaA family protein
MHQLLLAIQLRPEADFSGYVAGPNGEAVAALAAWSSGAGEAFLYLFGAPGTGKTHLLHAACREASARGKMTVYLPMTHPGLRPSVLEDLEAADLVALDDLQAIAGNREWEHALFDAYNRLRAARRGLLISADVPAADLGLELPDLRSRLGWGPGYRLRPLPEADCQTLLVDAARRRGLDLGPDLVGYIMRRCPRDASALLDLLNRLDDESLREQRRPSIWLVRQLLDGPA